jgi:Fe(3+) dicitrate transport protein
MPEVESGKIYSGKKTVSTVLAELPPISTNNYRQSLSQISGLLVSEVSNEGIASMNYRGLGDPHESFNMNLLRDGIPFQADIYGYPAAYYQPPFDSLDRIDFIGNGGSLMYGPQVGGALNFVTRKPAVDEANSFFTRDLVGEKNFYSTYNQLSGSADGVGYQGFFYQRGTDGWRNENADYRVTNGNIKLAFDSSDRAHWDLDFDIYDADHGEAGGLAFTSAPGVLGFDTDRFGTITKFDRLQIQRYFMNAALEYEIDKDTSLYTKLFGGYYNRFSRRQTAGTAPTFGGVYNGQTNNIVTQQFQNVGVDSRMQHNWGAEKAGDAHTLVAGVTINGIKSPYRAEVGSEPDANTGDMNRLIHRYTLAASVFVENRFKLGKLSVTPGIRLENISQSIDEKINNAVPNPNLRDKDDFTFVPLPGVSAEYELGMQSQVYASYARSFRPKAYQDTIPLNTGDTISDDLDPAYGNTVEAGVRGTPLDWLRFDASTFLIRYEDQFGRVDTNIQNVGNSSTYGLSLAGTIGLIGLVDAATDAKNRDKVGELSIYGNVTLLDAEFTSGPLDGKTPQYAPTSLVKTGLIYDYQSAAKIALMNTIVSDHYGDDAGSENRFIPDYMVWDLTGEINVWKDVSLIGGINNLFDEKYYSRVRSNGLDPALPRNAYAGLSVKF